MLHSISLLGAILAISSVVTGQILATQCYYKTDGKIQASSGHPCGIITPASNYTSCCEVTDTCLEDGLCHYTRAEPPPPSVVSRYYVGGCTDPSFNSPTCQTACGDINPSDVVYNQTLNIWSCCGQTNGTIHCENPTTESFSAPAPSALSATYTVPSTVVISSAPSSTLTSATTASASVTASATPTSKSSSSGLSTGAQAGIGIGAAIGGIAVLALIGFFFVRRRGAGRASVAQEDSMKDYRRYQDNGANPMYQRNGDTSWNAGSRYGQESDPNSWDGTLETSSAAMQKNAWKSGNLSGHGEPVEKMADSTLATMQVQELGNGNLGGATSSRYEMAG